MRSSFGVHQPFRTLLLLPSEFLYLFEAIKIQFIECVDQSSRSNNTLFDEVNFVVVVALVEWF